MTNNTTSEKVIKIAVKVAGFVTLMTGAFLFAAPTNVDLKKPNA